MEDNSLDMTYLNHFSDENSLELNTGWLIMGESAFGMEQAKKFKKTLELLFQVKGIYISELQLLELTKLESVEEALRKHLQFVKVDVVDMDLDPEAKPEIAYVNLFTNYNVQPLDIYYPFFFACKLRNLDLFSLEAFLEYHLSKYYGGDLKELAKFLKILIKEFKGAYLKETYIEVIQEWIIDKEKQVLLNADNPNAIDGISDSEWHRKGRRKREADDKMTCLNQEQTVLFINYLKQHRVVLNGDNLKHMDAGIAFSILTGYSKNTLRQNLSDSSHGFNKSNLVEIDNLLTRMKIAIEKDLKEVKAGKSDTKSDSKSDTKSNSKAA
jgi:hypothetical protein